MTPTLASLLDGEVAERSLSVPPPVGQGDGENLPPFSTPIA